MHQIFLHDTVFPAISRLKTAEAQALFARANFVRPSPPAPEADSKVCLVYDGQPALDNSLRTRKLGHV
ncbi:MAG: hypothetical protein WEB00_15825 [Dehalococcoidia bacterium]